MVRTDEWDGVGDGDRDGGSTLASFCLGLKLGYLDDNLLCLLCVGRFQYVWSPNAFAVLMVIDEFLVLCSCLCLGF